MEEDHLVNVKTEPVCANPTEVRCLYTHCSLTIMPADTVSTKILCYWAVRLPCSSVRSAGQTLLPLCIPNGLSNLAETCGE